MIKEIHYAMGTPEDPMPFAVGEVRSANIILDNAVGAILSISVTFGATTSGGMQIGITSGIDFTGGEFQLGIHIIPAIQNARRMKSFIIAPEIRFLGIRLTNGTSLPAYAWIGYALILGG